VFRLVANLNCAAVGIISPFLFPMVVQVLGGFRGNDVCWCVVKFGAKYYPGEQ